MAETALAPPLPSIPDVAVNDFSGLTSSAWALASAEAEQPPLTGPGHGRLRVQISNLLRHSLRLCYRGQYGAGRSPRHNPSYEQMTARTEKGWPNRLSPPLLIRLQRHIVASVFSVATASGLAMGFAVLARQNILVAIPCLVLLFDWPNAGAPRHAMTALCLVALCALIVVLPVFIVCGAGRSRPCWRLVLWCV